MAAAQQRAPGQTTVPPQAASLESDDTASETEESGPGAGAVSDNNKNPDRNDTPDSNTSPDDNTALTRAAPATQQERGRLPLEQQGPVGRNNGPGVWDSQTGQQMTHLHGAGRWEYGGAYGHPAPGQRMPIDLVVTDIERIFQNRLIKLVRHKAQGPELHTQIIENLAPNMIAAYDRAWQSCGLVMNPTYREDVWMEFRECGNTFFGPVNFGFFSSMECLAHLVAHQVLP
jgi:hypothetical protein